MTLELKFETEETEYKSKWRLHRSDTKFTGGSYNWFENEKNV